MGFFGKLFGTDKVNEMLQNGAVIIDVRTADEYKGGHVQGSLNIPLDRLEGQIEKIKKMNKPVVLCCASGMRSGRATSILKEHGITCCNGGSWRQVKQ